MLDIGFIISAFVTLFVIMDPPGLTPMFVALTQGMDTARRRLIAMRACICAAIILMMFTAFGEHLLGFVGISMHAFRIAGGVLLFLTALDMLFERRSQRREDRTDNIEDDENDPSIFPLAIPLLSGPGAIASVVLLAGQRPGWVGYGMVVGCACAVLAVAFAMFLTAGVIERILGKTGLNVLTRLLGMLLAALAVQFVLDGLKGFGFVG